MSKPRKEYIQNLQSKKTSNIKIIDKYATGITESNNLKFKERAEKQRIMLDSCFDTLHLEIYTHSKSSVEKCKSRPFTTCKNKFCNICSFIKSRKHFVRTYQALEAMKNDNIDFIGYHLTLTIQNPTLENYAKHYLLMNKAFNNFIKNYDYLNKYLVGFQAGRETSQSQEAKEAGTLHPHIHCLLLLKPEFYSHRHHKITQSQFRERWRQCCAYYGITAYQIQFKKIKSNADYVNYENTEGLETDPFLSAISEVAKYPTAPQDTQNFDTKTFEVVETTLYQKRQLSFGGKLKEYLAKQKESEIIKIAEWRLLEILFLNFEKSKYNVKKLTEKEQQRYLLNIEQKKETEKLYNQKIRDNATNFLRSLRTKQEKTPPF